ncbi:hypothetical protein TTHERM_00283190 (macronuclear) [Tetrahymena thermophila SB210]|uniref:Uncharacterized protein n=1 Tax=Tetrahymena thermophila (strain SB210) TaxID=312017 RepID=I7MEW5_TETTS|nr:hypothetical protein TTHERM_00283190 [Tetrahymena thermophila SB210]EAR97930.2 hypothetical protein TTHERM_00283190 [Tetrahymena thermophila SB210]|eukprot:XP_001018175.2 hypothetical protein TTHERM_00283190 [Tetrahymena thermophila SB210]
MEETPAQAQTIAISEVEAWLKEQLKPYLQRIEKLEENEKKKDSLIHSLELSLQQLTSNLAAAKDAKVTKVGQNGSHTTGVNGARKPTTTAAHTDDKKEDKKPVVNRPSTAKPTDPKPANEHKPATETKPATEHKVTTTRPTTAKPKPEENKDEKKSEGSEKKEEKKPVQRPTTAVKKDDKKDEKKDEKKEEKKPITKPATTTPKPVKKDNEPKKETPHTAAKVNIPKINTFLHIQKNYLKNYQDIQVHTQIANIYKQIRNIINIIKGDINMNKNDLFYLNLIFNRRNIQKYKRKIFKSIVFTYFKSYFNKIG